MFPYTENNGDLGDWRGLEMIKTYDIQSSGRICARRYGSHLTPRSIQPMKDPAVACLFEDSMLRSSDAFADRHYSSVVSTIDDTPISLR